MPRDDGREYERGADGFPHAVPMSQEIEQCLLGALLVDNRAFDRVSEYLKAEHFYAPAHARIFEAIVKTIGRGAVASPVTLKTVFQSDGDLAHIGGAEYLVDLTTSFATASAVPDYGRALVDLHLRRQLIAVGEQTIMSARAVSIDVDAVSILEKTEQDLFVLAGEGVSEVTVKPFSAVLTDVIETAQKAHRKDASAQGIKTGLVDLDRKIAGLRPGELIVLAGRPSMGKTALATNIALSTAEQFRLSRGQTGGRVLFFSLEMSAEELGNRIVCQRSGTDGGRVARGDLTDGEFRDFISSTQPLAPVPLFIDDTATTTVSQVRTRARREMRQGGLGLIVVDYLQLLRGSGSKQSQDSRVNEISEITRGLKAIAKELRVPVLALSQVSRNLEQRDDKRPMLSDLRESGTIEQDADCVLFVFREEYYLAKEEPVARVGEKAEKLAERTADWMARQHTVANVAELIVAKQRKGPTGTVKVHWDGPSTTFSDLNAYAGARYEP